MIVSKLQGGLGNQMFQYAVGRCLALHFNTGLALDVAELNDRTPRPDFTFRNYELNIFNLPIQPVEPEEIKKYYIKPANRFQSIAGRTNRLLHGFKSVYESNPKYAENILRAGSNCYLTGYWQNEQYFKPVETQIKKDFAFNTALDTDTQQILNEIKQHESVAVHIRRGDYLNSNQYAICSSEYYEKAIENIAKTSPNATFYFFSDDPTWAEQNIRITYPSKTIRPISTGSDLMLMSNCKHNIIANSSYSWWGAWLNQHPHKLVIAPQKWFLHSDKHISPDRWIKM